MDLLLVLPLILAIATIFTAAQQNMGIISLRGCPTRCGDIEVPYPFGFTLGCYRPGFKLNCNTTRLFIGSSPIAIEVTSISNFSNHLSVSVPFIVSNQDGISRNASWATALVGTPYTISSTYNNLTANGCGVVASLLDPDTGATVASCASFCGTEGINTSSCNIGFGCCVATIPPGLRTYSIRLDSPETESGGGVAAVMANGNYFEDDNYVGAGTLKWSTRVEVVLDWVISDAPSCKVALRDLSSYACLNDSRCIDMPGGYICDCQSKLDYGNPYVPNSCPEVVTLMSAPADCQRKCGDIDVPFPFGLERGCYRHENFILKCITENKRQVLEYLGTEVSQIMIEDGKLRLKVEQQSEIRDGQGQTAYYFITNEVYEISWVVSHETCQKARNENDYACISTDSYCFGQTLPTGYNCRCRNGYDGNPYIHGGCQDIDECSDPKAYGCYGNCTNLLGSFTCACDPRFHGNCAVQKTKQVVLRTIFICVSIGFGLLLLFFCGVIVYKKMKQRTREKIKQKHFEKNRDLLQQQKHSSNEIAKVRIKIFSLEDLEKATNNFDDTRIVGSGGYGTVYKGILSDQRVVAIKKSKRVEETEILQFINEIFILSIINHRNVVKLFGCCLEMEVPLLVFEFIPNGSLSDHLHLEKHKSSLSWDGRLRIAAETAGAFAYLHSAASISIFHGDVKTANILLDDNFSAKVSDFGASRSRAVDQTLVLTQIKGTDGYLDPEYQYTSQLTEKSDVYSFGVILVELLTGEMPISFTKCKKDMNLCMSFLLSLRENRLDEILEPIVTEGALTEQLDAVAKLAEACLNIRGEDRPTMKEVFARMESLIKADQKRKPELIRRDSQEEIEYLGKQSVLEL